MNSIDAKSFANWVQPRVVSRRLVLGIELICLGIILAFFVGFAVKIYMSPYLPSWEVNDGFGYFMQAKSFYINHDLRAALSLQNNVSFIGGYHIHGIIYPFINGGAAIVLGWHDKIIILINIVLLCISVFVILVRRDDLVWKLALLLIFLTYFITPTMTFSYMQESIQLLVGLLFSCLLLLIVNSEAGTHRTRLTMIYFVIVGIATLMRPSWAFWAVGLLASARTRRECAWFGFGIFVAVALAVFVYRYLYAPYPYFSPFNKLMDAAKGGVITAITSLCEDILSRNVLPLGSFNHYIYGRTAIPNIYIILFLMLAAYCSMIFWKSLDRGAGAVVLVASTYVAAIVLFWEHESAVRQIAPVFVLMAVYLVSKRDKLSASAIIVIQLLLWPAVANVTHRLITLQVEAGNYAVERRAELETVAGLASFIRLGRPAIIYVDNALTAPRSSLIVYFPLRSADGYPLRYDFDLLSPKSIAEIVFDPKRADFVLSAETLSRPDLQSVFVSPTVRLYRVRQKEELHGDFQ